MKETTDRELTDRISQVFDDFEDPMAEAGWKELRKKYPETDRNPVALWWAAVAAILLVVCGLWFIAPDASLQDQKTGKILGTNEQKQSSAEPAVATPGESATESPVQSQTLKKLPLSPGNTKSRIKALSKSSDSQFDHQDIANDQTSISHDQLVVKTDQIDMTMPETLKILTEQKSPSNRPAVTSPVLNTSVPDNTTVPSRDSLVNVSAKLLALAPQNSNLDEHVHTVKETTHRSKRSATKNHSISVYAGSYFNYSLGSETKLNFGAGITSDIMLANNLKLSTGLALAKNSLTYNNGVPSSSNAKVAYDALPAFSNNGGLASSSLTTVTRYDADLLALDIPVNIKYLVIPKDNKLYLLAGLSSGTYLSEKYSLDYRNYSLGGSLLTQGQGVDTKNHLQTFDIARTLNISFGYSALLGKSQNITIEPFVKYPLGGLGSEDLKFGSTGINLKLNFSKIRK